MSEKKVYLFLTNGISGINGTVIYMRNKKLYLEANGWTVKIICYYNGPVYVPDIDDVTCMFDFLQYYPCYFSKHRLSKCLDKIATACGDMDENTTCYIESHTNMLACWGEVIAERLNKTHIINFVQERPIIFRDEFYNFMKFKLERNELYGMSANSINLLMKGRMDVPVSEKYQMKTPCDNTVMDVDSDLLKHYDETAEFHICTVGRLEKPYVIPMIQGIIEFAEKHQVRVQLFIIAGAYHKENIDKVEAALKGQKLVSYYISGFVYPVPLKLLHKMDLAMGCAGSNLTTARAGVPTIVIDVNDLKPVGILGVTTQNTHYRLDGEPIVPMVDIMEEVLYKKVAPKKLLIPDYSYVNEQIAYHFEQLKDVVTENKYFDVSHVLNEGGNYKRRIIFGKIFGPELLKYIMDKKQFGEKKS